MSVCSIRIGKQLQCSCLVSNERAFDNLRRSVTEIDDGAAEIDDGAAEIGDS